MRRRWIMVVAGFCVALATAVDAGDLSVQVVDTQGHPVGDAVVSLIAAAGTGANPAAPATRYVDQKNETFLPYVQLFRPGDAVVFRNSDDTRHHVYSFSPLKAFEFMLRPGESSPSLRLEAPGVIAVGCNIHDHMIAYLVVSADPASLTARQGRASFGHLPAGHYTVRVWHPQLRPGTPSPERQVNIPAGGTAVSASFSLTLLPDPRRTGDREHLNY